MPDLAEMLGATRSESTLLVLFIPSHDRFRQEIIQCYTSEDALESHGQELRGFLVRMGTETKQGAVGLVIDGDYLEIAFELPEAGS